MKKFRLIISGLMCLAVFIAYTSSAVAREIGVVNLNKVIENYTKAQEVTADLKVKEAELQKFVLEAQKKIKKAKTPVEKKNLEENLGEQFNIKRNAFAKEQAEKWQKVEENIYNKIEEISKDKKLGTVLKKQSVIIGGVDITDEVIKQLNEKKPDKEKKGGFGLF